MPTENDTTADAEQAIETVEATDTDHIRGKLPEDVRDALTKRAFSPGALRKLLRDTYYMGPIGVGRGGWRGVFGGGQPGTQLRRPDGALYNFPRSWRYAALERALTLGFITHTGSGRFASTERGVAVLRRIDTCPDCGVPREPYIRSSYYVGDPNSEGHLESHSLVTACPECGADGYGDESAGVGFSTWERDDDAVEFARKAIADHPDARVFGVDREIRAIAADETPDTDADEIESLLDEHVENQTPPSPREQFSATDEGLFGRPVVTIPGDGPNYRFKGTAESLSVSRTDAEGEIHITRDADDRLKVGMGYNVAVEHNVKDVLHYDAEGASWSGDYWTVDADALPRVVSKLTIGFSDEQRRGAAYYPDSDDEPEGGETWFTVTVDADAMDAVTVPMFGVDADGQLVDPADDE